ncbi:MAG: pseudouridine synthase, RluA family [Acidimicrobiales bacterium]|jgi:23S rRNA pseudouridine1911/1915/1917 synthase|nr:pseudouridine synthase, RluA family [Acidimicrobiales bacterium]
MRETVPRALAGERVDRVVSLLTGVTRADAAALVAGGAVRVGGRAITTRSRRLAEGDVLDVEVPPPGERPALAPEPDVTVPVVHEDADVIVVDKPPGLVVHPGSGHPTGTMVQGLLARYPELAPVGQPDRPGVVHRLDAGTSGLLVVARSDAAYTSLVRQLKARSVDRRYLALVWGRFDAPAGMIDAPIGRAAADPTRMAVSAAGRAARTRYEVRETFTRPGDAALVECRLETGRTHQIRVHLAAIGHPVAGDRRYRGARGSVPLSRPFLHAHRLAFDHPASGERVAFASTLPADLEDVRAAFS